MERMEARGPEVTLDSFVGQDQAKRNIRMLIDNTPNNSMPPHMLLIGGSGTGKTTLSQAIYRTLAGASDAYIEYVEVPTGKTISDPQNVQNQLLRSGNNRSIFFFDEVHQMKPAVQESLYEPLTKASITFFMRQMYYVPLAPLCIIAATTEPSKLLSPFSGRFQHVLLEAYTVEDIRNILLQYIITDGEMTEDGAMAIAQRSKDNPRIAHQNLSEIVVAYMNTTNQRVINEHSATEALTAWGIDDNGFTELDWRYLRYLYETVDPQGISNIAGMIGSDAKYLEERVEPYMLSTGLVMRTKSGRRLAPEGVRLVAIKTGEDANDIL
jgi:Holliday junction DNA helicase RuvB